MLPPLYQKSFLVLCNFTVLPVVDGKFDRFSYGFRPFRDSKDIFLEIKNFFSKKQFFLWTFKSEISFSIFNTSWIIKYFPFNKNLLNLILLKTEHKLNISKNIVFFSTLFNFLLNGLVRVKSYC